MKLSRRAEVAAVQSDREQRQLKGYLHDGLAATTMPRTSPPPSLGGLAPPLATPLPLAGFKGSYF